MLERYPGLAAQVFQRFREHGFAGGYSLVKTYTHCATLVVQAAFLRLALLPANVRRLIGARSALSPWGKPSAY